MKSNSQILAKLLQSIPEPRVMCSNKIRGSGDENVTLQGNVLLVDQSYLSKSIYIKLSF